MSEHDHGHDHSNDPLALRAEAMEDLLRRRVLWKRVFEVTAQEPNGGMDAVERATDIIRHMGHRYEVIKSSNSLTRFRPRGENEASRNY